MYRVKKYKELIKEQEKKDIFGTPVPVTTEEDITNYYKCNDCGNMYHIFNELSTHCPNCGSHNIKQFSNYDFFTELKKGDKDVYNKELRLQKNREANYVDLIGLEYIRRKQDYRKNIN